MIVPPACRLPYISILQVRAVIMASDSAIRRLVRVCALQALPYTTILRIYLVYLWLAGLLAQLPHGFIGRLRTHGRAQVRKVVPMRGGRRVDGTWHGF